MTDLSPTACRTILTRVLGARGALLSVLVQFFEDGRWGLPVEMGVEGQRLTAEDQLFILMQSALYLTVTRGLQTPEVRTCYGRAESLCHSLNRPRLLHVESARWRAKSVVNFEPANNGRNYAGTTQRRCRASVR